jgi:hypothetical protein
VEAWEIFQNSGWDALRTDAIQLEKLNNLIKSNNLALDANRLEALLRARTATRNLPWEHPENILDAVQRASDANIPGLEIKIKGFPTPEDGAENFVLNNAKQFQREGSGDAFLSFETNGISFDNIDEAGVLVDRKWGHSASIFKEADDGFGGIIVHNRTRANSILEQALLQVNAAPGLPIRWEISTELGARGIRQLFENSPNQAIRNIEVIQQLFINGKKYFLFKLGFKKRQKEYF